MAYFRLVYSIFYINSQCGHIFSSSATLKGNAFKLPRTENLISANVFKSGLGCLGLEKKFLIKRFSGDCYSFGNGRIKTDFIPVLVVRWRFAERRLCTCCIATTSSLRRNYVQNVCLASKVSTSLSRCCFPVNVWARLTSKATLPTSINLHNPRIHKGTARIERLSCCLCCVLRIRSSPYPE